MEFKAGKQIYKKLPGDCIRLRQISYLADLIRDQLGLKNQYDLQVTKYKRSTLCKGAES